MKLLTSLAFSFCFLISFCQPLQRPKLVIGIVVDQMKYDYIYRYWDKLGDGGFKRLLKEGYEFSNTRYNYAPTITGPGHASIYTGTTPATHGIISNDWYSRTGSKNIYCVDDSLVKTVGTEGTVGMMSPTNLLVNTIGDELKLATNFQSRVIGIALKDRGAILPAGHAANAAYWFDSKSGNWISSSYYMKSLPDWAVGFNALKYPEKYNKMAWNTLLDISKYTESTADNTAYENPFKGEEFPVFPHDFNKIPSKDYENIRRSPFGNTLTKDFAEAIINGERLGAGPFTDMLCLSFSSTDYIGHQFGTNAIETEDCYLRLDKDLEEFLDFIDKTIGKKNVLIFLTADHGALQNPQFLIDNKFNAGFFDPKEVERVSKSYLQKVYNDSRIFEAMGDQCIYLNHDLIKSRKLNIDSICNELGELIMTLKGINNVYSSGILNSNMTGQGNLHLLQMAYNPQRSGDLYYTLLPAYIESTNKKGTTHGAPYNYDTHVPLLFYGFSIEHGHSSEPVNITDIAPTISSILRIEFPSGNIGNPLNFRTTK